jgi:hypothetical protein
MCGACGRTVVADPVFPGGRTTRGNLIAGQIIDRFCGAAAPGRVRVTGRTDGFVISAPGRRQTLCATVGAVWTAVLTAVPATLDVLESIPDDVTSHYADSPENALLTAVVESGRAAARDLPRR